MVNIIVPERVNIIAVVAADENNVIGNSKENEVPWRIGEYDISNGTFWNNFKDKDSFRPNDMGYFVKATRGFDLVMGRLTAESMEEYFPLYGRFSHVLSRNSEESPLWTPGRHILESPHEKQEPQYFVHTNLGDAIKLAARRNNNIAIIGGGGVYQEALEKGIVDAIHLNRLNHEFEGDVKFPPIGPEFGKPEIRQLLPKPEYQTKAHTEIYRKAS